jgi:N,N'-diacetyllegionaminate synthase
MQKLILEICQNHRGSITLLEEMIHAASETGAKFLKIQDIHSSELTKRDRFEKGKKNKDKIITIKRPFDLEFQRLSQLDMDDNFIGHFISLTKKYKCKPIVTPFSYNSFERLKNKKLDYVKIASYDCSALLFLEKISTLNKPMIVSTGASRKKEIIQAAKLLEKKLHAFLHCVTIYPTPLEKCNLLKIQFLKTLCKNVGWSDHTLFSRDGHVASLVSILCGANYIERHFTILKKDKTKDGPVSINPKEAKELLGYMNLKKTDIKKELNSINKNWKLALGKGTFNLSHEENLNRDYYRGRFAKKINNKIIYNWERNIV